MDYVNSISYAKISSRRIKLSERHINLLGGSSLLQPKKADNNQKIKDFKAFEKEYCEANSIDIRRFRLKVSEEDGVIHVIERAKQTLRTMSYRTKTKIREKAHAMLSTYGYANCTFLTLTFINQVSDEKAQKLLNKFLTVCRQRYSGNSSIGYGSFSYLWVAERQDGKRNDYSHCTGNVHFHVLLNMRLPIVSVNALWIRQQYRSGITHPKLEHSKAVTASDKELQKFLNPVDIDTIHDESMAAGYLVKYMAKSDDSFKCQVWNCSKDVSAMATKIVLSKRQYNNSKDRVSNMCVNRQGKIIEAQRTCHYDHENRLVAVTSPVINLRYFNKKYLKELALINRLIVRKLREKKTDEISLIDHYRVTREWYIATFNICNN